MIVLSNGYKAQMNSMKNPEKRELVPSEQGMTINNKRPALESNIKG